jgi:hypothetical protein
LSLVGSKDPERMAEYSSAYYDEHFGMVETLFQEARIKVRRV